MIGTLDHQMRIERKLGLFADKLDNSRSKGNVIDEMPIHNVAMNPIRARLFHASDFVGQS